MRNFTSIEQEFQTEFDKELGKFLSANQNVAEDTLSRFANDLTKRNLFSLRKACFDRLFQITGRNTITYISSWLQHNTPSPSCQINDNDMNGFMNAVSGLDYSKGLDLVLHTPGGVVSATESIVNYLRKIFRDDIRIIVPHMAMSAGTLMACASKEIVMGKQSSLGPIDPHLQGLPVQGILKEFERAAVDIANSPNTHLLWGHILQQYRPALLGDCQNNADLAEELIRCWLSECMFKNQKDAETTIETITKELTSHDASKVHDRHYDYVKCRNLGLKVVELEKDQALQDAVLSMHHSYVLSICHLSSVAKFIENQNGLTIAITM